MMSQERRTHARETYAPPHKVLTNDDLLTEILIRLPILCIHLFTTVSKQWLKILTSLDFTRKRNQITKFDPPIGLFVNHIRSLFKCAFVSLDSRLRSKKSAMDNSFTLGSTEEAKNVKILDDIGSSEFTIHEMMKGCSIWSVRYHVDTDNFMTPLPEGWSIRSTVWRILLGERKEDSLLVINLCGKVVQYNLISKTLHDIFYCGSKQLDDNHDDDDDELLQQLEAEHNIYEFILSFARV
ncbi:hypothetical protein Tco_0701282 [Tanacetum coccineum]